MTRATQILTTINNTYGYVLIFLLVMAGVFFTFRLRGIQIRGLREMGRTLTEQPQQGEEGAQGISAFRAFTVSAASRVGTGNVMGVGIAIATGGPGAVLWMWILALLGGATAFAESTLGQLFKVRDTSSPRLAFRGGPAYYISRGLRSPRLAVVFCLTIIATYGCVFNMVQSNTIARFVDFTVHTLREGHPAASATPLTLILVAIVIAILTAAVIFGGIWRVSAVSQVIVPIMATLYLILGIIICVLNYQSIPHVLHLVWDNAWGIREVTGGGLGAVILHGVRRGLYSNEAGMGSVPNASATAAVSHPVKQGFVQTLGVYFDTLLVCSITAFIILLANEESTYRTTAEDGVVNGFLRQFGAWSMPVLMALMFFLAFSSIIGNYYYGETNIQFLTQRRSVLAVYRTVVVLCVAAGAVATMPFVWALADTFMSVMATINIVSLLPLSGLVILLMRDYLAQRQRGDDPVFTAQTVRQDPALSHYAAVLEVWDTPEGEK